MCARGSLERGRGVGMNRGLLILIFEDAEIVICGSLRVVWVRVTTFFGWSVGGGEWMFFS